MKSAKNTPYHLQFRLVVCPSNSLRPILATPALPPRTSSFDLLARSGRTLCYLGCSKKVLARRIMTSLSGSSASAWVFGRAKALQAGVVLPWIVGVTTTFGGADVLTRCGDLGCSLSSGSAASRLINLLLALSGTFTFQSLFHYLYKIQIFNYKMYKNTNKCMKFWWIFFIF